MCILFCRWRDFRCYVVMKNYITIQEITDIYKISQSVVNIILEKYKIDSYKGKKWILINFKDFHKAYTSAYNPSLFSELDKKVKQIPRKPEEVEELLKFWDETTFLNNFSISYNIVRRNSSFLKKSLF